MRIAVISAAGALLAVTACGADEPRAPRPQPAPRSHSGQVDPFSAAVRFARKELEWPAADPEPCFVDANCADDRKTVYVYRSLPCPADGTRACEVAVVGFRRTPTGSLEVAACEFIPDALATTQKREPCKETLAPARPTTERPTNEQALQLIRSCEVRRILFLHSGYVHLTLRGGRSVFVVRPNGTALAKAADVMAGPGRCDIAIAIE